MSRLILFDDPLFMLIIIVNFADHVVINPAYKQWTSALAVYPKAGHNAHMKATGDCIVHNQGRFIKTSYNHNKVNIIHVIFIHTAGLERHKQQKGNIQKT